MWYQRQFSFNPIFGICSNRSLILVPSHADCLSLFVSPTHFIWSYVRHDLSAEVFSYFVNSNYISQNTLLVSDLIKIKLIKNQSP